MFSIRMNSDCKSFQEVGLLAWESVQYHHKTGERRAEPTKPTSARPMTLSIVNSTAGSLLFLCYKPFLIERFIFVTNFRPLLNMMCPCFNITGCNYPKTSYEGHNMFVEVCSVVKLNCLD
jgi:hypothetical protein